MKRKFLSTFLALVMVLTLMPAEQAAESVTLTDVSGHWAERSITRWVNSGVVQGSDGQFDPNGPLTCGQLATILSKLLKLGAAGDAGFSDNQPGAWYYDAVNRCAAAGILNGNGDGTVDPNGTISRERAMVMLGRALGIEPVKNADLTKYGDGAKVAPYAEGMVAAMIEAGIVSGVGDNQIAPKDEINRASTVTILDRAIGAYANEAGASVSGQGGITLVVADDVTVTGDAGRVLISADNVDVTLLGSETADHVAITGDNSTVTVKSAGVESANVSGDNSKLILESANAGDVTLSGAKSKVETKGTAKVDSVSVTEDAAGATVSAGKGTTIGSVENDAEDATVTGSGTVSEVKSSTDVTVETKDTDVKNTGDEKITVSDSTGKDTSVSSGSTTTTGSSTSGSTSGSSSGSHSHRYSDEWSYDADYHWHASTCGHDVVSGKEAHTWNAGVVTKEATETEKGEKTYTCTVCGYVKTEEIPELNHVHHWTLVSEVEATCTTDGTKAYYVCSCGEKAEDAEGVYAIEDDTALKLPKLGHDWGEWEVTTPATEESTGVKTRECSRCDAVETAEIPRLDHVHHWEYVARVEATCTEEGTEEHYKCTDDGTLAFYPADEDGTYRIASDTELKLPMAEHSWDGGVVTTEPTAAAEGEKTYTCAVCGATKTESVARVPVEIWTGYTGSKAASYATLEEAAANLGGNTWIVLGGDYTFTGSFTIPDGVFLDIANGATLTVAEGATLTVPAAAKRLGVRTGAALVNNGTVLVCGTSYSNGYVMIQDGGTADTSTFSVPDGYILGNNSSNYFAVKAIFEIAYSDGTTKQVGSLSDLEGATKATLLEDVNEFAGSFSAQDKLAEGFVLDLGGHTLTGKANTTTSMLTIGAPMTIRNGTIKYIAESNDEHNNGALNVSADVTINSDVVIDGGKTFGIWTDGYGHTLTVNGTVKSDGYYAITSNGMENGGLIADCSIVVNEGAEIKAPNGIGIYHPERGTVTVNGGEITGNTGVQLCAGKLVVTGGSITSVGENQDVTGSQNAILDGAAVSIISRNYPGGTPEAEITGGTFTASGTDAQALRAYDYTTDAVKDWADVKTYVKVTGGTYSNNPSAYVAEGYGADKNADGTWTVVEADGSAEHPYLISTGEQAYNMRNQKGYFKLVDDVVVTNEIYLSGKTVTIDLNGHSVKLAYADDVKPNNGGVFNISGKKSSLTINDSSNGEGKVIGSDKTYANKVTCAVRVGNYGKLTINGGHFYGTSEGTSCIFTMTSRSSGSKATVVINGGTFETATPNTDGTYYVLNHQDSATGGCTMTVNGGTFKNYNPGVTVVDPVNAYTGKIVLGDGCTTTSEVVDGATWYTVSK